VSPTSDGTDRGHLRLLVTVRAVLLAFCVVTVLAGGQTGRHVEALLGLVATAVAATLPVPSDRLARLQPIAEGVLAGLLLTDAEGLVMPLIPYLLAPALAAGLAHGAVATATTTAAVMVAANARHRVAAGGWDFHDFVPAASQWAATMLAVGLLAAWVRRVQLAGPPVLPEVASYAAAYRLISQLRLVARQLSSGLDPVTLAESLLQSLQTTVGFSRGALYVRSPGGRLVPLAHEGNGTGDWPGPTGPDELFGEVWASQEPRARDGGFGGVRGRWCAALPLRMGLRTFGIVGLEDDDRPFDPARLRTATTVAEEGAQRLETALLFEEVRSIATAEERRRVAREIHDGIAQELASLGYVIDDLAQRAAPVPDLADDLAFLRAQLSRTITELRLSIFELRSEVHPGAGLGTALSDYVRQVGAGSALTVHLVLDESPRRLRVETETELLRIAQEAVANARKHARANNLWVTCRVEPPAALIRVEDDGVGLGQGRRDSFGLDIMRERAARLGGRLDVRDRAGGGTLVEVSVGPR
jgi:signal transduction histidine kinase